VDYLTNKVIDLLDRCGFGYLKVDYNETAGLGFENKDSLGEGLRKQIEGQYCFFEKFANACRISSSKTVPPAGTALNLRCSRAPRCRRFPTRMNSSRFRSSP
jgi:hypothetical protein